MRLSEDSLYTTREAGEGGSQSRRHKSPFVKRHNSLYASNHMPELHRRNLTNLTASKIPIKREKGQIGGLNLTEREHNISSRELIEEMQSSIKILPVIGSEVSLEESAEPDINRLGSNRLELTRKEVQNFLVNGSVSKEFIHSNRKNL